MKNDGAGNARRLIPVLFAFALIIFSTYFLRDKYFVSGDERKAGFKAISEIDAAFGNIGESSEKAGFLGRKASAQESVGAAHAAAKTSKDRFVANQLDEYLDEMSDKKSANDEVLGSSKPIDWNAFNAKVDPAQNTRNELMKELD